MARRGLQSSDGNHASGENQDEDDMVDDLSGDDDSFVFDEGDGAEAGEGDSAATFVGEIPLDDEEVPAQAEKTEILSVAAGPEDYPVLTIEAADGSTSDVEVVKDRFILGRSPDSDVVIPDSLISRQHAIIEQRDDGWYLVDQNSGNGTFLNDERVRDELLYDGDVIAVGDAVITFGAPGEEGDHVPKMDATQMLPAASIEGAPEGTSTGENPLADPGRKKRKKLLLIFGVLVVLLGAAGITNKLMTKPEPKGPTPAQIAAQEHAKLVDEAEKKFVKLKQMVKDKQWQEALPLILEVAEVVPETKIVKDYKATIEKEAVAAKAIEQARTALAKNDFNAASASLAAMPADSMQAQEAQSLKKTIDENRMSGQLEQARTAMIDQRWDDAIGATDDILKVFPDNKAAYEIKRKAEEEKDKKKPPTTRKKKKKKKRKVIKPQPKPKYMLVGKALALYRSEQVDQSLSQAGTAGVSADGVKTLRRFQSFYKRGKELSRNPGQSVQAIKFMTKALKLDKKLSGGKGTLTDNLKKKLAKVYFLQGVDAHTRNKFPLAYKSFTSSLRYNPGLDQAKKRLQKLEIEAKKLFETAYVIKGSSPEKAVKHCKTVMGMVQKAHTYYGKCKKLIGKIRGPMGEDTGDSGEGF
jgi:pSer/pThr/pTyr-binding forkhead associated (FHA) protein/tetratricopeptide (TPR) repeat protein